MVGCDRNNQRACAAIDHRQTHAFVGWHVVDFNRVTFPERRNDITFNVDAATRSAMIGSVDSAHEDRTQTASAGMTTTAE